MTTIRADLAVAARQINKEFRELDPQHQHEVEPKLEGLGTLPDEIAALPVGEARALIADWRDSNLAKIRLVSQVH